MKTVLTGIKPTGDIHIGNYLGAIRPGIKMAEDSSKRSLLFIADYHSLTSMHKAEELKQATYHVAAAWIASGLDPNKTIIYRQSDIPEIFELTWILSCFTPKGFMNRAHGYKATVQANAAAAKKDLDIGVSMGLYNYPVLMAADILMFNSDEVPVGEDQIQHVEFTRDIAQKFNNNYGEVFTLPKAVIRNKKLVLGLDGRKMSKSYNNTIPIFTTEKKFRKLIMKIKTDSLAPEAPKKPEHSIIFDLYKEFASKQQIEVLAGRYKSGIGWGEAKEELFNEMNKELAPMREKYNSLMSNLDELEQILQQGAKKARVLSNTFLQQIRSKIGMVN